jgi:hypothetical protein
MHELTSFESYGHCIQLSWRTHQFREPHRYVGSGGCMKRISMSQPCSLNETLRMRPRERYGLHIATSHPIWLVNSILTTRLRERDMKILNRESHSAFTEHTLYDLSPARPTLVVQNEVDCIQPHVGLSSSSDWLHDMNLFGAVYYGT